MLVEALCVVSMVVENQVTNITLYDKAIKNINFIYFSRNCYFECALTFQQVVASLDDIVNVGAIVEEANKIFIKEQTKEITTFCHHPGRTCVTVNEKRYIRIIYPSLY